MPSKSKKQHNLMAMVANNPKAAKRLGIPQSVGEDFVKADKNRKFNKGGEMKDDAYMKKERKHVAAMKKAGVPKNIVKEEMEEAGMKKGGKVKCMADGGSAMYKRTPALPTQASDKAREMMKNRPTVAMKKGGKVKGYDDGGDVRTQGTPDARRPQNMPQNMPQAKLPSQANIPTLPSQASDRAKAIMAARLAARTPAAATKMARGGGVEKRGKTKGKMVKMAGGGFVRSADGCASKGKTKGKII